MKAKFNLMDGLIVLVLLAVLALGGIFLGGKGQQNNRSQNATVSVMVEFTDKDKAFSELPQVGDVVMVGEKEKMKTTVTKVEALPAKTLGYDVVNGAAVEADVPGRYDVLVTLEGSGVETAEVVKIDGNAVRVGQKAVAKSKNWAGNGYILAVDTVQG